MYKLKNTYIDKMVRAGLSSREVDFILYVAVSQDDAGTVGSVYYKDVCGKLGISIQKFYDVIKALCRKGLISWEKLHRADIRVRLLDNDFSKGDYGTGYLKVGGNDFSDGRFRRMKAGSKLLYLYMQRFVNGKHMLVRNFYDEFCRLFSAGKKSLQEYLRELKEGGFLFVSKKRNKAMHYEMVMKNSGILEKKEHVTRTERDCWLENVKELVRRNFPRFVPDGRAGEKALGDIAMLAGTKKAGMQEDFISLLYRAVEDSIRKQREEGKVPKLNAALVNICLGNILGRRRAEC